MPPKLGYDPHQNSEQFKVTSQWGISKFLCLINCRVDAIEIVCNHFAESSDTLFNLRNRDDTTVLTPITDGAVIIEYGEPIQTLPFLFKLRGKAYCKENIICGYRSTAITAQPFLLSFAKAIKIIEKLEFYSQNPPNIAIKIE